MLVVVYVVLTFLNTLFRSWAISILWNMFMPRTFNLPMISTLPVVGVLMMVSMLSVDQIPNTNEDKEDILYRANWSLVVNMGLNIIVLILGVITAHNL